MNRFVKSFNAFSLSDPIFLSFLDAAGSLLFDIGFVNRFENADGSPPTNKPGLMKSTTPIQRKRTIKNIKFQIFTKKFIKIIL